MSLQYVGEWVGGWVGQCEWVDGQGGDRDSPMLLTRSKKSLLRWDPDIIVSRGRGERARAPLLWGVRRRI